MYDTVNPQLERELKRFGFRKVYIPQFKRERDVYDNGGKDKTPWLIVPGARPYINGRRIYPESYDAARSLLRKNSEMLWEMVASGAIEECDTPICERIISTFVYYGNYEREMLAIEDEWNYAS